MKNLSKLGLLLASTYILVSVSFFVYAVNCVNDWCGLAAFAPALPWSAFVFNSVSSISNLVWLELFALYAINAIFIYGIGFFVGRIIRRIKNHKEDDVIVS